jgi:hypothetical protein
MEFFDFLKNVKVLLFGLLFFLLFSYAFYVCCCKIVGDMLSVFFYYVFLFKKFHLK